MPVLEHRGVGREIGPGVLRGGGHELTLIFNSLDLLTAYEHRGVGRKTGLGVSKDGGHELTLIFTVSVDSPPTQRGRKKD